MMHVDTHRQQPAVGPLSHPESSCGTTYLLNHQISNCLETLWIVVYVLTLVCSLHTGAGRCPGN
jgi:hypothetical protein